MLAFEGQFPVFRGAMGPRKGGKSFVCLFRSGRVSTMKKDFT
jgi:hypothetical protein